MNILIVSGFLGAGKTTFIKEPIRRTGANPVILENEYGENSIDARELRDAERGDTKLEVLEFMEGCVCCTMKDSFVNSVMTVFSGLSPEYLIVEPTGVGRLGGIIDNLRPILHDNIRLLKPVVVVTPRSCRQNMREWETLYRDQVANAGIVVFSKCETESPELLSQTEADVRRINPDAEIIREHYTGQDEAWWRSLLALGARERPTAEPTADRSGFSQLTLTGVSLANPALLILLLEDCLRGEYGRVVRAKGTVGAGGETLRFDLADGLYSVSGSPRDETQCVFIGEALDRAGLCRRMGSPFEDKPTALTQAYLDRRQRKRRGSFPSD